MPTGASQGRSESCAKEKKPIYRESNLGRRPARSLAITLTGISGFFYARIRHFSQETALLQQWLTVEMFCVPQVAAHNPLATRLQSLSHKIRAAVKYHVTVQWLAFCFLFGRFRVRISARRIMLMRFVAFSSQLLPKRGDQPEQSGNYMHHSLIIGSTALCGSWPPLLGFLTNFPTNGRIP